MKKLPALLDATHSLLGSSSKQVPEASLLSDDFDLLALAPVSFYLFPHSNQINGLTHSTSTLVWLNEFRPWRI